MADKALPRGIRNHNPGNIRHGQEWQGMAAEQTDTAFVQFKAAEFGLRALAKVLLTYQAKHGLRTVRTIITRWAPPSENDTEAYIASVAGAMRVRPDDPVVLKDRAVILPLIRAIVIHENGRDPYTPEQYSIGLNMAGIGA